MESHTLTDNEIEQLGLLDEDFEGGIDGELDISGDGCASDLLLSKDDREFLVLHYGDHFLLWKTLAGIKKTIGRRMKEGDMSGEDTLYAVMEGIRILDNMQQVRQFNAYGGEPVSGYARELIAPR